MRRETVLAILRFQLLAGIVFAIFGSAFGFLIYFQFHDSGVPNGINEPPSATSVALIVAGISIVVGGLASYVARACIKRFR